MDLIFRLILVSGVISAALLQRFLLTRADVTSGPLKSMPYPNTTVLKCLSTLT